MASFATWSRNVLLIGCISLAGQAPGWAQSEPKLSKPLNLGEFVKPAATARPRRPAKPMPSHPLPAAPVTTGAIAKTLTKTAVATTGSDSEPAPAGQQSSDAAKFCSNIADAALDARVAWQQKELEAAEAKLRQRIAELEAKRAEYEQWLKLREDFLQKAEDSVVEIYSRMNPEAAAQQISSMADNTAAAVLAKLKVRSASAILNEMEPARGAQLADTLAGMRRADDGKTKK
jgi:flagellar motility protein MotE (MotC chaperone)